MAPAYRTHSPTKPRPEPHRSAHTKPGRAKFPSVSKFFRRFRFRVGSPVRFRRRWRESGCAMWVHAGPDAVCTPVGDRSSLGRDGRDAALGGGARGGGPGGNGSIRHPAVSAVSGPVSPLRLPGAALAPPRHHAVPHRAGGRGAARALRRPRGRTDRGPWADPGARFTALFEALVIDWLREASFTAVARRLALAGGRSRASRRGRCAVDWRDGRSRPRGASGSTRRPFANATSTSRWSMIWIATACCRSAMTARRPP